MRKLAIVMLSLLCFTACENNKAKSKKRALSASSGNMNTLSIVMDNDLWEGVVGEHTRAILGEPVYGLPQEEPTFSLRHMPSSVFTGFARKNRIIFKVELGKAADTKFYKDPFATPQKMVLVTGQTKTEIIDQLKDNSDKIITSFKATEIKEKQKRIKKSLGNTTKIQKALDVNINYPSAYRIATEDEKFFWIRRDIDSGSINLMLYEMPMDAISNGEEAINDVIKIRDSIGKKYIPGPTEGTFMRTEEAYTPFMQATIVDNKPALETKSTWHVKGAFMAGPFINYVIQDKDNQRLIIVEGFVYAPAVGKRDYVFELESIIKSITIN
ncbi:MAG: DUF4837 family protein [Flavobacteriaceae bacterium]|nr:DUF4837 family protein [Flavobacteriaceae bacterium]